MFVFELFDDETGHFRFGERFVRKNTGILCNPRISLLLERAQGLKEFPLIVGWLALFE